MGMQDTNVYIDAASYENCNVLMKRQVYIRGMLIAYKRTRLNLGYENICCEHLRIYFICKMFIVTDLCLPKYKKKSVSITPLTCTCCLGVSLVTVYGTLRFDYILFGFVVGILN